MDKGRLPDLLRRHLGGSLVYGAAAGSFVAPGRATAQAVPVEVWTGPACTCCHDWIERLEANGFTVSSHDGGNGEPCARLGMPVRHGSCHAGYPAWTGLSTGACAIRTTCC